MKNYNWEYFKSQINKKLSEPETKNIYSQRKIDVEPVFGFMKAILGFTRMSVRGLNKVKRELGFVLMALNIRKVVAQRAENNQKFIKRQFLYYFNRNCLFSLIQELYVPDSFFIIDCCSHSLQYYLFIVVFIVLLFCILLYTFWVTFFRATFFRIIVCTFSIFVLRIP